MSAFPSFPGLVTADRSLALLYFEQGAVTPQVKGLGTGDRYRWTWP